MGASFEGYFTVKGTLTAIAKLKEHVGEDAGLHGIAESIETTSAAIMSYLGKELSEALLDSVIRITSSSSNYSHEMTMSVDVEPIFEAIAYELGDAYNDFSSEQCAVVNAYGDALLSHARSLARWLYLQLEKEYEYQSSEEYIADYFAANDHRFTDDGLIFKR